MKLRYKVNQGECFRAGINCERSIQVDEVDPATLLQEERNLIGDRLRGIDVVKLGVSGSGPDARTFDCKEGNSPLLIEAKLPGLEHLIAACRQNQLEIDKESGEKQQVTK